MPSRRFIQMREPPYDFVEVGLDYTPEVPNTDGALWNDRHYNDLKATDGTDISSRQKHQRYMKENGLCTIDDFTETNRAAQKRREDYFKTGRGGATSREDIARTVHKLESEAYNRKR